MIRFITENFNLHSWKIPGQTENMKVVHLQNLTYVDSGLSCDTFNIIHITNGHQISESEISEAINYFRDNHLSFCIWCSEENLTEKVRDFFLNLSVSEKNSEPGMSLDLFNYKPDKNELYKNIIVAENRQQIGDYAYVVAANWTPVDTNIIAYYKRTADNFLKPGNNIMLLVFYLQGKAVSTIEMFPSDNKTIGLYGLATLSAFRGKGIGSSLIRFSLNKAKECGFKRVILQASEDGISIYRRLGFKAKTIFYEYA